MIEKGDIDDPKGLIFEAYRIEGITPAQCRSIFLDWALSLPSERPTTAAIARFLDAYGDRADHPMTTVLREGQHSMPTPRRRGGWRSRPRD
ncbi:hypothetical protein KDD17_05855 [Sulfitobacter albidus]|uniref:Uncharacterized protein n=1 Tax=Sulfitobacter albidus TaxID=2829501 RepID=A0A975JFE2_9RHOB|nr:hypothetical protein [Sulfitobacter albidus]QUJ77512.1 hypothetical protein KDD17_05855 [Sulfitobacter albidus]